MHELGGHETFALFMSIRLHFHGKYDFFKYGHKAKSFNETAFLKRKDKYFFQVLAKKYNREEMILFFVANIQDNDVYFIKELLDREAEEKYLKFVGRIQSIHYRFSSEMDSILSKVQRFSKLFKSIDGNLPPLINLYFQKKISIETLIILDRLTGFSEKFDRELDNILWYKLKNKMEKLAPFLTYDLNKLKIILRTLINTN